MKKTVLFISCLLSLNFGYAQAPEGVGYQGVATDAYGIELVNQAISIRASVLSGSATGTIEWQETHTTTTDTFGLFTLTIGQGTNTTNGAQASFADISWGTNTHFLKIEMDVTGGSSYSFMGTNQMMSVPYALYAESANINYDSISNLLSNDSTFITTVGGGLGGGGCNLKYPDGIGGESMIWWFDTQGDYTVPSGKTLYMFKQTWWDGSVIVNGTTTIMGVPDGQPLIIPENSVITDGNTNGGFSGFLIDKTVESMIWWFNTQGDYTVPSGKTLYIFKETWWDNSVIVNGTTTTMGVPDGKPLIIPENSVITDGNTDGGFNGYLVDDNYFSGCGGGGGSSSASSLDSTEIANMIAAAGGGGSSFGDIITINSSIENEAQQDGFLYGQYYLGGPSDSWIKVYCDTFSGNTNIRGYYENNPYGGNFDVENTFMIPIKQGEFYSFVSGGWGPPSINNLYFFPLESGGVSTNNSNNINISQYGDTLYINGQAIVIPGVSQSNLNYQFHNYNSVTDANGNVYKTLIYGNDEWMIENLKTITGSYVTTAQSNGSAIAFPDSIGYYYSASDAASNICPSGWHVPTISEWQDLHYEIYGTNMNASGATNPAQGFDYNNYQILWSVHEGGTNQAAFNLFRTGIWINSSGYFSQYDEKAAFWSSTNCGGGNMDVVSIYEGIISTSAWSLSVGCTSGSNAKAQIRCVKD